MHRPVRRRRGRRLLRRSALDPFAEHNGYRPAPESSTYDDGFVERYRTAQLERIARIDERARAHVAEALDARTKIKAGTATSRTGTAPEPPA